MVQVTNVDKEDVTRRLMNVNFSRKLAAEVVNVVPNEAIAVVLYGSRARGDVHAHSDVDLLVVAEKYARTRGEGLINVTTYVPNQIESANGSLFGMHLARDAVMLHDPNDWLVKQLRRFTPANPSKIFERVRAIATALKSDKSSRETYLNGMVRLARYLLRTALYAKALDPGPPCFSISGIAERFGQPELETLLSAHELVHGSATLSLLDDLQSRIEEVVGAVSTNPYSSLHALIVAEWDGNKELANASLLALSTDRSELQYAQIPRIIL